MATNPVVKLKRGDLANLQYYPAIDGQLYFADKAQNVITSTEAASATTDYNVLIIDSYSGNSVVHRNVDAYRAFYAQLAGAADVAAKWSTARTFQIKDADATNSGTGVSVDGSAAVTLKLPSSIKANITGNLTGIADKAKALSNASGTLLDVGSSTTPVYFDDGVPVAVSGTLDVSITGSAATAAKWASNRSFQITDSSETNTGTATSVDGSAASYKLKLPATIQATLSGRATSAGKLTNSSNQDISAGSATKPVYFSGGVPVVVGSEALEVTVQNAQVATKLSSSAGGTTTPVYFSDGKPVAVTGVSASLITGTLPMSVMPAGALERLAIVSQTSTLNTDALVVQAEIDAGRVQAGDVVQVVPLSGDSGLMYFIYDDNGTLKYKEFVAGTTMSAQTALVANKLTTARTFSISGAVTATGVSFDGSNNVTLTTSYNSTVPVNKGGTNKTSWNQYRLLYADTTSSLDQIAAGDSGQVLLSGGTTAAPGWHAPTDLTVGSAAKWSNARSFQTKLDKTTSVSVDGSSTSVYQLGVTGTLGIGNGGTGKSSWTQWGLVYASATNALSQVAAGTVGQVLVSNGNAAPGWANATSITAGALQYVLSLKMTNTAGSTLNEKTYGGSTMTGNLTYEIKASDLFATYTITDLTTTLAAGTWYTLTAPTGMTTGSYIVQIKAKSGTNSVFNDEYFTGVMSYSAVGVSGASADSDEVLLHASGKNNGGKRIYLRVTHNGANAAKIEIQSDAALTSGTDKFDITFRRII